MLSGKKALAYARVSTPDQAETDLSIPAQIKAIRKFAEINNISIGDEYIDEGVSAYNDEVKRIYFNAMIQHAISDSDIKLILVHDTSRFFRNKYKSAAIKGDLIKYGVSVVSVTSPYDPNTIDGAWRESIEETMAMTSSMQTAFHTRKGMVENASKRDPETGYCYKNGGRSPYGYKLQQVNVGKDSRGKDRTKLLWEVNPDTSPILRRIIIDMRIGEGLSYKRIRDQLNIENIPGPEGKPWGTSTIREMLVDNRLIQYTGTYFWNKEDHKTKGKRYKDQSEWLEIENAHPSILTIEEAEAAMAITKSRQPRTPAARSYDSRFLLTGLNLEGQPFFTCKVCGKNIVGAGNGYSGKYICSSFHNKGSIACQNNTRISHQFLERNLLAEIEKVFGAPEAIDAMISEINSRMQSGTVSYNKGITALEKELKKNNKQIELTFDAFSKGIDADLCNERLTKFKSDRLELTSKLEQLKKDQPHLLTVDPKKAHEYFTNSKRIYESGSNEQRRQLFKTYVRRMELDPDARQVNVTFYPHYLDKKIKREHDYSRCISSGVGDGT